MGRELRRKEAKKNGIKLKEEPISNQTNWKQITLTIGIILLILVILYFILAIFVTKDIDLSNNKDTNTSTQENSTANVANPILANAIFKQSEEVYYVYCYDFSDIDTNVGNTISSNLIDEKVYRVNTKDSMNSKYVSEEGNKNSSSLDNLVVSNPTLIKIENDTITLFLVGSDEIINYYK